MLQQQVFIINTILMVLDALCVIVAGYSAYYARFYLIDRNFSLETEQFVISVILIMIINNYALGKMQQYSDKKLKFSLSLIWPIFKAVIISFTILSTCIFIFKQANYSRLFMSLFMGFTYIFLVFERSISHLYLNISGNDTYRTHNILIVGSIKRTKFVDKVLSAQLSWGHKVIGRLSLNENHRKDEDCLGTIDTLPKILRTHEIDEVVFAINNDKNINLIKYLNICKRMGISVRILPSLWKKGDFTLSVENCQDVPFLTIHSHKINANGVLYKRILDIIGGSIGCIILCLIYPLIAIAIKLNSPGPVIFKQKRIGQNGRSFFLYKFRSMYENAEERKAELYEMNEMKGAIFKIDNDPRITRVGRWLRKNSIDEFPQFVNVLKGDMSLVGTRPPTPSEVNKYLPEHMRRISAKPGITGLWQISGRNEIVDFERIVELDCQYLDHWRFFNDIIIILKTIIVVLRRKGAK
jgi:exopolysaccharide biosynthesis polyprenyl glycosylphosphotransferase